MAKWNSRCSRDDNSLPGAHPAPAAAVTAPFSPTFNHLPIRPPPEPLSFPGPDAKIPNDPSPISEHFSATNSLRPPSRPLFRPVTNVA